MGELICENKSEIVSIRSCEGVQRSRGRSSISESDVEGISS